MSGFFVQKGKPHELPSAMTALRHRGPLPSSLQLGSYSLGLLNRETAHFEALATRNDRFLLLFEGWSDDLRFAQAAQSWIEGMLNEFVARGPESWCELSGAFVIIAIDTLTDTVWIARDPAGLRPAYYWTGGQSISIGSELKAVLATYPGQRNLNTRALCHFLVTGLEPHDYTLASGIIKPSPGHLVRVDVETGEQSSSPFFSLDPPLVQLSSREVKELTERTLDAALASALSPFDRIGLFLSGGIDSYILGQRLTALFPNRATAATAGIHQYERDETERSAQLAKHLGLPHTVVRWQKTKGPSLLDLLQQAVGIIQQPARFANALLIVELLRSWKDRPLVVASGDGADGVFGNPQYRDAQWNDRYARLPGKSLVAAISRFLPPPLRSRLRYFAQVINLNPKDFRLYVDEVFDHTAVSALMGLDPTAVVQEDFDRLAHDRIGTAAESYCYLHLRTSGQGFIDKLERLTAYFGMDLVLPFLMPQVLELAFSLPLRHKHRFRNTKPILRSIAADTLGTVESRKPKIGFDAPRNQWLREDDSLQDGLSEMISPSGRIGSVIDAVVLRRVLEEFRRGNAAYADTLWTLLSADRWCRELGF